MKQQKMISIETNLQNAISSKFYNNEIVRTSLRKIKGGDDDFVITEDCVDL